MEAEFKQLSLIESAPDLRAPETVTWNLWHGCSKVSFGCQHCYMYRRDHEIGKDPTVVRKTQSFNLPVRRYRSGEYKGMYKLPPGSHVYTCFSSDFFHKDADEWRNDAWDMIRERSDCTFFMITKRPERIAEHLPYDWGEGWDHVEIAVTCENQWAADKRLPVYLPLPIRHKSVMVEPMLERVNLRKYFEEYKEGDHPVIETVAVGGESGPEARVCDYAWVIDMHMQCVEYNVGFHYHQTGARLKRGNKEYNIPKEFQHTQADAAGLEFEGWKK